MFEKLKKMLGFGTQESGTVAPADTSVLQSQPEIVATQNVATSNDVVINDIPTGTEAAPEAMPVVAPTPIEDHSATAAPDLGQVQMPHADAAPVVPEAPVVTPDAGAVAQ
jgi:hypothetical protein